MELTIEQELRQGIAAHKDGKLQEAERFYLSILKSKPTHTDANHNMGVLLTGIGKFEEALPFFQKAISIDKKQEQYWISLIKTLIRLGKIGDARNILSEAINSNVKGDKIISLSHQLNQSTKLDFFYKFLKSVGIFNSKNGEILNGNSEAIPLLTSSFLNWFETQEWNSLKLLELGSGNSTLYFSKFFKSVTSYETNQDWFDRLSLKIPINVNLIKVDSIIKSFKNNNIKNIHSYDVILIDAGENRAKISRWLVDENYKGIIFFDNSEWYRKSVGMLINKGFLEIPFFGIKPIEDWVSCTSIVAEPSTLKNIFKEKWVSLPKLTNKLSNNLWDDEFS